jgi:hypothetical protein
VATMLEKLGFRQLVEETLTVGRKTRAMTMYQFVLAMMLACYVGFSRLFHLRFLKREPMLTGVLAVLCLPPQSTFWRFLASLHLGVARQLLHVQRRMRERVWEAANVQLTEATLDTDTTVHTLFGNQMGARKSYNPKNKGKKSYQPILTFLAETKEYVTGSLRTGDRPDGEQIAAHLDAAVAALPPMGSASSSTSRKDGTKPTGSWPCGMRRSRRPARRRIPNSTSCSIRRSTPTGFSSPTWMRRWMRWWGSTGGAPRPRT